MDYLDTMLRHKFFHRARKVPVSEQELKARGKKEKKSKDEPDDKKKEEKITDAESSHVEGKQETAVSQSSIIIYMKLSVVLHKKSIICMRFY